MKNHTNLKVVEQPTQKKYSLAMIIERMIECVDYEFPAALDLEAGMKDMTEHSYFKTPRTEKLEAELLERLRPEEAGDMKAQIAVADLPWQWLKLYEVQAAALGFTAGARAAGLSKDETKVLLTSLLRNIAT